MSTTSANIPNAIQTRHSRLLDGLSSEERKCFPMTEGLLDYFPDALAYVAYVSWLGNEKHNPGEKLHWARGKSMDHPNCITRHLSQRGTSELLTVNGQDFTMLHSGELAWRALALLQEELEALHGLTAPRGTHIR